LKPIELILNHPSYYTFVGSSSSPSAGFSSPSAGFSSPSAGFSSPSAGFSSPSGGFTSSYFFLCL